MLRSLFSGVSGLRAHQQMMDVTGNNIANVNTVGFKGSSVMFQDLLSQTLSGAGAPTSTKGGTDPAQVGLGVRVAAIQQSFAQGSLQVTGKSTDVAIQGDGFFIVNEGGQQQYTRAGSFHFDGIGNLVSPDGGQVQGWRAAPGATTVNATGPIGNIKLVPGQTIAPVETKNISIGNTLSADAAVGATVSQPIECFDSQGGAQKLNFTFTKTGPNSWTVDAFDSSATNIGTCALTFDPATGRVNSKTPDPWPITPLTPAANWPVPITVDFGDPATNPNALKEFGGASTVKALSQDGSAAGTLQSYSISNDGVVSGVFSNGKNQVVGQIALANFNNPAGLEKAGGSNWRTTADSGIPQVGAAGAGGLGGLSAGSLEMSNVDLGQEFTNLIIAQRGFQANSKVITSSDQLLQDLLNMKQ